MSKVFSIAVLSFFSAVISAQATDNMKAFPPAEEGMVRYVLQLPKQDDESVFKVELIIGKAVQLDEVNKYFFGGHIDKETITGWGYPRYTVNNTWSDGRHAYGGRSKRAQSRTICHARWRTIFHPLQQPLAHRGICS